MRSIPPMIATVGLLALIGCDPGIRSTDHSPNNPDHPQSPRDPESGNRTPNAQSQDIQRLAESKCGKCHLGSRDSAIPSALEIFDLTEPEWWTELSNHQLDMFPDQFRRMGDDLKPDDLDRIEQWVAARKRVRTE